MVGKRLGGLRDLVGVVGLAGLDRDHGLELVVAVEVVAFELDVRHHIAFAFVDVHRERDRLLVGRNGDLGRLDAELEIAALQIVRAQGLQIGVELGARIAIGLGVPAEPAAGVLVEQALERGFAEGLVADHVDLVDLCRLAFGHRERQVDAVALDGRHGGDDFRAIEAAVDVLALELLLGTVGERAVERPAFGQTHVAHGFLQGVLVELLGAGEVDVGNRRTFLYNHREHVAVGFEAHVLEQAQSEQRTDRGRAFFVVVIITHTQGDGRKNGTRFHPLQTFDADVLDLERLQCPGGVGRKNHGGQGRSGTRA